MECLLINNSIQTGVKYFSIPLSPVARPARISARTEVALPADAGRRGDALPIAIHADHVAVGGHDHEALVPEQFAQGPVAVDSCSHVRCLI